jgi:hypothetical protein
VNVTYKDVIPWVESLKELGRVAVIACIPVLIDGVSRGEINWELVVSAAVIALLRALDKLLHLEGKIEDNATLAGGLTRF